MTLSCRLIMLHCCQFISRSGSKQDSEIREKSLTKSMTYPCFCFATKSKTNKNFWASPEKKVWSPKILFCFCLSFTFTLAHTQRLKHKKTWTSSPWILEAPTL
jgi:hypothetical protein